MNYGILPSFFLCLLSFSLRPLFFVLSSSSLSVRSPAPLARSFRPPTHRFARRSCGRPATRVSRLCSSYNCARGAYSRSRGSHGRASLFLFPPRVGFCAARKQQQQRRRWRRRQRRGKDRKTEGSRESKSSGYIAALDRRLSLSLSILLSFSFSVSHTSSLALSLAASKQALPLFSSAKNARASPIDRFANAGARWCALAIATTAVIHCRQPCSLNFRRASTAPCPPLPQLFILNFNRSGYFGRKARRSTLFFFVI